MKVLKQKRTSKLKVTIPYFNMKVIVSLQLMFLAIVGIFKIQMLVSLGIICWEN